MFLNGTGCRPRPGGTGGVTGEYPGGFLDFDSYHKLSAEKKLKIGQKLTRFQVEI